MSLMIDEISVMLASKEQADKKKTIIEKRTILAEC